MLHICLSYVCRAGTLMFGSNVGLCYAAKLKTGRAECFPKSAYRNWDFWLFSRRQKQFSLLKKAPPFESLNRPTSPGALT